MWRAATMTLSALAALLIAGAAGATSLWSEDSHSLYSNRKASRVGDVITVVIDEASQGYNRASSNSKKEDSQSLGGEGTGPLDFIPLFGWDYGASQEFKGNTQSTVSGGLRARVSAQVVDILSNGHLVVQGSRELVVNGEKETISVFGEVRPEDVRANNTVLSTNVANAQIHYDGSGPGQRAVRRGILHRIFGWIF
jgi:flagellar L-ring protein precursor FlgH